MASTLDSLRQFALVLQRGTGDTTGQNLALLVHETQQEIGILVVDVFDAVLLEAAVLFGVRAINSDRLELADL